MWKLSYILNENIKCHCMQIELNLNWIQIQLKRNGLQIGGKVIENLAVNMALKKTNFKNIQFHDSLLGNGLNKCQFGIV